MPDFVCRNGGNALKHRWTVWLLACLLTAGLPLSSFAAEGSRQVVLSFAGDCTLGSMNEHVSYASSFVQRVAALGFDHPFSGVRHIFEADDLTLVNLEGTFTNRSKGQEKAFLFRAPPEYAEILALGSVEAVAIANNHILDFWAEGRRDTMAALTAQGILYAGDGILSLYETNGIRIGMTAYSYPHRQTLAKLEVDISALRAMGCDIVIFSMHAGREEQYETGSEQRAIARGAIDLGADIVVGHHPHVLQGVEVYEGKPIFYSLGNFSFGGNYNPKDWDTMIAQVVLETDDGGVYPAEIRLIPCLISGNTDRRNDFRPVVAEGARAEAIMEKIARLSPGVLPSLFEIGMLSLRDMRIQ